MTLEDDGDALATLTRKGLQFGVNGEDVIEEEMFSDDAGGDESGGDDNLERGDGDGSLEKKKKKLKSNSSPTKTSKKDAKRKGQQAPG
jgi:hypothetical protein